MQLIPFRPSKEKARKVPRIIKHWLIICKHQCDETQNYLWAWEAFNWANHYGLKVPEWVTDYLGQVAAYLLKRHKPGETAKNITEQALSLALHESGGRGNAFSRFQVEYLRIRAAYMVFLYQMVHRDKSQTDIYAMVADEATKVTGREFAIKTIEEWYLKHRDHLYPT